MNDLREIIAKNISELRASRQMTQSKLAELLNYSDKAVSKWERAESVPDITVIKDIADLFGVSVDYLLTEEHKEVAPKRYSGRNKALVTLLSFSLVYLVATLVFVTFLFVEVSPFPSWLVFIYALVPGLIVLLVFNSIWGRPKLNYLIISLLIWSILLSVYLTLSVFVSGSMWFVFLLGIPAEIIVSLWSFMLPKKARRNS